MERIFDFKFLEMRELIIKFNKTLNIFKYVLKVELYKNLADIFEIVILIIESIQIASNTPFQGMTTQTELVKSDELLVRVHLGAFFHIDEEFFTNEHGKDLKKRN